MNIAIVGSRSITDYDLLLSVMREHFPIPKEINYIISGGAKGVDTLAEQYARDHKIPTVIIKPNWKEFGAVAGFIRNEQIVEQSDVVVALWNNVSNGTKNSMDHARKHKKRLIRIDVVEEYFL